MIARNHGAAAQRQSHSLGDETVLSGPPVDDTVAGDAKPANEAEITRLTWAVLDGKATPAERLRLAELVNAQHEERDARHKA